MEAPKHEGGILITYLSYRGPTDENSKETKEHAKKLPQ